MAGPRLREFRVTMIDADLRACEGAGVRPEELVATAVRDALDSLVEPSEEVAVEEEPPPVVESEEPEDDEEEDEEEL